MGQGLSTPVLRLLLPRFAVLVLRLPRAGVPTFGRRRGLIARDLRLPSMPDPLAAGGGRCQPGGLRIHDLRHTAVALWIAAGASPQEVAARAGHTSVSFVLDRYGHLFPGYDAELRDRLDAMHAEGLQQSFGGAVADLADGPSRDVLES
jgi:integrase